MKKINLIKKYQDYWIKIKKIYAYGKIMFWILLIVAVIILGLEVLYLFKVIENAYHLVGSLIIFLVVVMASPLIGYLTSLFFAQDTIEVQDDIDNIFQKSFYSEIHYKKIDTEKVVAGIRIEMIPPKPILDCILYKIKINLEKLKIMPYVFSILVTITYLLIKGLNSKIDFWIEIIKQVAISPHGTYLGFSFALMYYYEVRHENEIIHKIELLKNLDLIKIKKDSKGLEKNLFNR